VEIWGGDGKEIRKVRSTHLEIKGKWEMKIFLETFCAKRGCREQRLKEKRNYERPTMGNRPDHWVWGRKDSDPSKMREIIWQNLQDTEKCIDSS